MASFLKLFQRMILSLVLVASAITGVAVSPPSYAGVPPAGLPPAIAGSGYVGQVLRVGPVPAGAGVQWRRDGVAISGATSTSYTLISSDVGKSITVVLTRTSGGFGPISGGGPPDGGFAFDAATARYLMTGDSITALDDMTGFPVIASGLAGAPLVMPGYFHQGVSGSEINEGTPSSNAKDLLYPTRKQLLEDAVQAGDVVGVAIGTNSVSDQSSATTIAGLTSLYGGLLQKGAFLEIWTVLPSASNAGTALNEVNDWIRARETLGLTFGGVDYPATKFLVVDGYTAWGGTYVGHTDSGNLHPNTLGTLKLARAKRAAYKAKGRASSPLVFGTSNLAGNLLTNWNLAGGTAGTLTGSGNTLINNGVPTGVAVTATASAGLTIQTDIISSYSPTDSLYGGATFPALKVTVTGTAAVQADIAITMAEIITSEPAGSAYDASAYTKWKGVGATADPTGLFAIGFGYGSVGKWSSNNSSTLTNYTNVTLGDEAVLRTRSIPTVQAFGSSSIVETVRVRSGEAASFELYFAQPFAAKRERTAYAVPKSLHTDQDGIGGVLTTGPQVGTSNTSWTATSGTQVTGRPGKAWFGGGLTFQFTWQKLGVDGTTITDVAGPTTVTATASTTQFTPSGVSGEKFRLKVTATNSFGSGVAYSVWSSALP